MSTHDYVINNQSASAFRADLNDALQAIVTTNSSSTAPATTYANMLWYDTANNQLKKRNEADSLWIILGTINEAGGTFTTSGERSLATLSQAEAGTDNTTVMTPLRTAQAITALASQPTYQSAEWTAASYTKYTFAHGLGAFPSRVDVLMRLTTTTSGWASGTTFICDGNNMFYDGADAGFVTGYGNTNVIVQFGSDVRFLSATTGGRVIIPFANCVFSVRAWK